MNKVTMQNRIAGIWVKAESDKEPKEAGLYVCMIEEKGDGVKSQYPAYRKYDGYTFLLATDERLVWWLNEDEQPIPVNQDDYWQKRCEAAERCYDLLNLGEKHKEEYKIWAQLKSSPSPTPQK